MENQPTNDSSLFNLRFDENAKEGFRAAAIVAGIAAIVTLARAVISITAFFVERSRKSVVEIDEGYYDQATEKSGSDSVLSLILAILVFLVTVGLFYFLYRFATKAKSGISNASLDDMNEGMGSLANYFKTIGILFIILLALVVLGIFAYVIALQKLP
jgi:NADH:ubiquinone oxidoreductase subunit 5 (subunit L)/multisubunit Na+/H+ antiporter MnhA subunit